MIHQKRLKLTILRMIRRKKELGYTYSDLLDFIEKLTRKYGHVIAPFLVQVLNREIREELHKAAIR